MSDIYKAKPSDVYVDENGKLWRVISTCSEPTVTLEEIEPSDGNAYGDVHERKSGGVSGLMWQGFKRIWESNPKREEK